MSDLGTTNSLGEGGEEKVEKEGKNGEDLKPKFLKEFAEEKRRPRNSKNFGSFVSRLFSSTSLSDEQKKDLRDFKNIWINDEGVKKKNDREKFDLNKIDINDLKNQFKPDYIVFEQNSDKLEELFTKDFDLSPEEKIKLKEHFKTISQDDFYIYARSFGERKKLLEKNGIRDAVHFKDMPKFFTDLVAKDDFEERRKKFTFTQEQAFKALLSKAEDGAVVFNTLEGGEVRNFYEHVLNEEERKQFLRDFLPYISLEDLRKYDFVNDISYQKIKKEAIKKYLARMDDKIEIKEEDIEEFLRGKGNQFDNILISTENINNIQFTEKNPLIEFITWTEKDIINDYNNFLNTSTSGLKGDFYKELQKLNNVTGAENFEKGSVIMLNFLSPSPIKKEGEEQVGERKTFFLEIAKIDEKKEGGGVLIIDRGTNKYNPRGDILPSFCSFPRLYDLFKSGDETKGINDVKVDIVSGATMQEKIDSGEIAIDKSLQDFKDEKGIDEEIANNQKKLNKREEELRAVGKSEEEISQDLKVKKLNELIKNAKGFNIGVLKDKIDEVDESGKEFGLEEGTTFFIDSDVKAVFTIKKISYDEISIILPSGGEEYPNPTQFFEIFRERGGKRVSKAKNGSELQAEMLHIKDIKDKWEGIEFKNNKFILKGQDKDKKDKKEKEYECNIFMSPGKEEGKRDFIKLNSIHGNKVNISFGEREVETKKKGKGKDEKETKKTINYLDNKKIEITIGHFAALLKKMEMSPISDEQEKEKKEQDDEIEEVGRIKKDWRSRYMQGYSFDSMMKGITLGWKGYTERLDKGSEEKAAMFANNTLGKIGFLPLELRTTFQSKVESEQKKRMEEYINQLEILDSKDATKLIEERLLNKDVSQYKLEAGLVFLMQKYGVLYAKTHLQKYQGSFLWYRALGGKVNDKLYKEVKAELEDRDECFVEEQLVYVLLVRQCRPEGYNGIKRRSKLHKQFKKIRSEGKDKEIKDGLKDAGDERTMTGRLKGFYSELINGNTPNALGWAKQVMGKGSPGLKDINEPAFVLAFSGVAYDMDNVVLRDFCKNFPAENYLVPIMRFLSTKSDIELLNKAILATAQRIGELDKTKYPTIGKDAEAIFSNLNARGKGNSVKERVEAVKEFYKKYGEVLTRSLYNFNDGKTDEDSRFNKLIELERKEGYHLDGKYYNEEDIKKDEKKKERTKIFHDYYHQMNGLIEADAEFHKTKDLMEDSFNNKGISGININAITHKTLAAVSGGAWRHPEIGPLVWGEIRKELMIAPHRKYPGITDEKILRQIRMNSIKIILRGVIHSVLLNNGGAEQTLRELPMGLMPELGKWGVNFVEMRKNGVSYSELEEENNVVDWRKKNLAEKYIDKYANNLYDIETGKKSGESQDQSFSKVIGGIQDNTTNIISAK